MPYALDLDTLPIGAIVVAVDCWSESPVAVRVVERDTHHVVGRTSAGALLFLGGPLIKRLATPDEGAAFGANPQSPIAATAAQPSAPAQMEMF